MGFRKELLPPPDTYFENQGLTLVGRGVWRTTRCVFHGGSDSMRLNTSSGGWVCMNCGVKGGDVLDYHMKVHRIGFVESARQLGAWVNDGSSPPNGRAGALPRSTDLESLSFESNLIAIAGGNIARGICLTTEDRERLFVAAGRVAALVSSIRRKT